MKIIMKKSKYKEYGSIYSSQCVNCIKEGTYHCKLEITDKGCKNFNENTKDNLLMFGGY